MKRLALLGILLVLLSAGLLAAQGAPDQINLALADLSQRVGRTLTLTDVNWRWAQEDFGDTSLGCPQPEVMYPQVVTPAYIFTFELAGVVYDYRVSADRVIVLLCSQQTLEELAAATPTPVDPNFTDPFTLCPNPEAGLVYQPTRLTTGIQGQVATGGAPNNLRTQPSTDAERLVEIPPNAVFRIEAGPQCGSGLLWWQVNYDGTVGWTAEGEGADYWLEPVPGRALPANLTAISPLNAASITEQARVELNVIAELAASASGANIAVMGGRGTDGLWLFDLAQSGELRPTLFRTGPETPTQLVSADFSPQEPGKILLGDVLGNVRIWDLNRQTGLLEVSFLQGHQSDTSAVAYSADGARVASVGSIANTLAEVDRNNAILIWDVQQVQQLVALGGHTARVNALAFSPDGTLLASGSGVSAGSPTPDNSVRLWDAATGAQLALFTSHAAPVRAVQFSPDGSLLASASLDGTIILWDVATRTQTAVLQNGGPAVLTLAFNPAGTVLASAGGDPNAPASDFSIVLWDVANRAELARLAASGAPVGGVAFSADGRVLVSVDDVRTVHFWGTTQP